MVYKKFDLIIIGAGINGAGIARDAAGRGLKVLICDKGDLGGATSSASSKLIHGGLRYLENYEFGLVDKALRERENLLKIAPHIIWPLAFILPHAPHLRPRWMLSLGLFLYDHLGGPSKLSKSYGVDLKSHISGEILKPSFTKGFCYMDGWVQDHRLVILNLMDAARHGATILSHTKCEKAHFEGQEWSVTLSNKQTYQATYLINATGPWVNDTLTHVLELKDTPKLKLVKGSHLIVKKLFDHPYAYIFQNPDKRIFFVLPFEQDYTLIGTTEAPHDSSLDTILCSEAEKAYLLKSINAYLKKPIAASDVLWSYAGVRPLYDTSEKDSAREMKRDYVLDEQPSHLLNIYGGKITTYRKLSEDVCHRLQKTFSQMTKDWTHNTALPGGDFQDFEDFLAHLKQTHSWLPETLAHRYARNYGTLSTLILKDASSLQYLGKDFGEDVYEAELLYLRDHEWMRSLDDFLWRRTKLGLRLSPQTIEKIRDYLG